MTKNKPLKRIITFCLALIIALGIPITAFAEQDWYGVSDPLTYTTTVKIGNHTYAAGSHSYVMRLDESNRIAYCIQPDIMIGADESDWLYESGSTSPGWEALSSLQRQAINLLLLYGYPNQTLPGTKSEQYFATRMMIWEIIMGYRNENKPFNRTDSRCYDAFSGHSGFVKAYNELQSRLVSYYVRPSFAGASRSQAPTIALNYNPSTKQYETSVTDTNNVLSSFNFSMSGVTFTRNGNTLKISTAKEITTETAVSSTKPLPAPISSGILVWRSVNDPGNQELITGGGAGDPVPAYFKLKTNPALGSLKIVKSFELATQPIENVEFLITGPHDYNQTFATDENGEINITDLPIGEYTVTEIESELTEGYVLSEPQTVTVAYQQLKELEIDNRKIRGSIEISKEDVSTGEKLPDTGIRILDKDKNILFEGRTDKNGIVKFENLEYGSYYYQEFDAPEGYVIDESLFPFEVTGDGEIIKATMHNRMISSEIIIHKVSSTDGSSLYQAGIRFKDAQGNVIAEGYTDENGIFSTILTYGEYTWEEFQAPDGFILDPTPHKIIITEDGKVIKETLRNDEKVELVATGDTSDSITWGIIAALSAIGIVCYFVLRIRKKQKAEK